MSSFLTEHNNCIVVDKQVEKIGIGAVEAEGQANNTDTIYQPAAANVMQRQVAARRQKSFINFVW